MASFTVEISLTEAETSEFNAYIDEKCLDSVKWLQRQLYSVISSTVSRYKKPKGTAAGAFRHTDAQKGPGAVSAKKRSKRA